MADQVKHEHHISYGYSNGNDRHERSFAHSHDRGGEAHYHNDMIPWPSFKLVTGTAGTRTDTNPPSTSRR